MSVEMYLHARLEDSAWRKINSSGFALVFFKNIKRSKEIEILRKRLKKLLHTLEHSKYVSTRKRNDGFCPDALAV